MEVRPFPALLLFSATCAQASLLPLAHLDRQTIEAFQAYADRYEKTIENEFAASGRLWIDSQSAAKRSVFESGKVIAMVQESMEVSGGHLHRIFGTVRVPGATIEIVHREMQNYAKYQHVYAPSVAASSGDLLPDSTPDDQHYHVSLRLQQTTFWLDVAFETAYDTHYVRLDPRRSRTRSRSTGIREYRDAHNLGLGLYPEGDDHGFIWRIATWWHARERDGGVDLELTNITLTRSIPAGFGWWASRKARQSVESLLHQTRMSLEAR